MYVSLNHELGYVVLVQAEQEHLRDHYSSNFTEKSFYVLVGNPLVLKVDPINLKVS